MRRRWYVGDLGLSDMPATTDAVQLGMNALRSALHLP